MFSNQFKAFLQKPLVQNERYQGQKGMSILEILIVIGLMGVIMTLIATTVLNVGEGAREDTARLGMQKIQTSLDMYRIHNYRYPSTEQGLRALVEQPSDANRWRGPYTDSNQLRDPWNNTYHYESDGRTFRIISPGPDGVVGTEDDVVYPEEDRNEQF